MVVGYIVKVMYYIEREGVGGEGGDKVNYEEKLDLKDIFEIFNEESCY